MKNLVVAILVTKLYQNDPKKNNFGYQKQYPKNPKIAISIYTREAMFVSLRSNKRSSDHASNMLHSKLLKNEKVELPVLVLTMELTKTP